jgi:hypothetical protein
MKSDPGYARVSKISDADVERILEKFVGIGRSLDSTRVPASAMRARMLTNPELRDPIGILI